MSSTNCSLSDLDFSYICQLAETKAAIIIEPEKRYLVEMKLSPLAEDEGFQSLTALIHALRTADKPGPMHVRAIDALTINETSFFRDQHPFDALKLSVLPKLIEARKSSKRLRIWSAAASTGQEAYSIGLLIRENFPELSSWDVKILGTDYSAKVLQRAREGVYTQHEVNRGLPAPLLAKHFNRMGDGRWQIRSSLKQMVEFLPLNLIENWPQLGPFDLVFLRNVLIYFNLDSKRKILAQVARHLAADGLLALGTAETTILATQIFQPIKVEKSVFFQKL